jgi:hypothetical protein
MIGMLILAVFLVFALGIGATLAWHSHVSSVATPV